MRGAAFCVVLLLLAVCRCAAGQDEGAWMRFDPAEEYHGLAYDSRAETESRVRYVEQAGKWCIATEQEAGQYYIDFSTDPQFVRPGPDVLSVTIEYLDNGLGPIVLQYESAELISTPGGFRFIAAPVIWRRNTGRWKRHTWQVRDAAFGGPDPDGHRFRLMNEGWGRSPERDVYVTLVQVSRACLWPEADPRVLPADGRSKTTVTVIGRDASGDPLPDGTEVSLHVTRGTAPERVALNEGRATFEYTAGDRDGTGHIIAVMGEVAIDYQIFLVDGGGPARRETVSWGVDALAAGVRIEGSSVAGSSVAVVGDGEERCAEVRVGFAPDAERRADIICPVSIAGMPERLALDIGSDGSVSWLLGLLEDARGERFVYVFRAMAAGALQDWAYLELDARGRAYSTEGWPRDGIIDLPTRNLLLRVWFEPECEEGVVWLRSVDVDMLRPEERP